MKSSGERESCPIRKGLFFSLLIVSLAALAGLAALFNLLGTGGNVFEEGSASRLSFKSCTLQQVLDLDLEIDPETCGEKIESPELETLQDRVARLRGLTVLEPIVFRECSDTVVMVQIQQALSEEESEEELEADRKLMVALGLIPPEEDLEKTLTEVYTEQVAGSYDMETEDITIIEGKGMGELMEEITLAHEVTHALQDQHFDLEEPPLSSDDYNGDNDLAVESLIEGDAMVTMMDYALEYVDVQRLLETELQGTEVSSEKLDEAPLYLRRALMFPYERGMEFVTALKEAGGEAALDRAFGKPPLSTEQIMHPDKYMEEIDDPRPVPIADISASIGSDWKKINDDSLGEFDLDVWFEQFSGLMAARDAAGGWGGNTIQYYEGPDESFVVVNMFAWDTPDDARQFFDLYSGLIDDRFEGEVEEIEGKEDYYLMEAGGQFFYCGVNGDGTLCLQSDGMENLARALSNFDRYPAAR